jgi:DNA-binding transcriptional MerR regulator
MVGNQEERAIYSIGAVARMLDIPTSTLRGWEERYSVIVPNRSRGSQRLYSRSQVEQLRFVKSQMEAGKSAADAHRLLDQRLASGDVGIAAPQTEGEHRTIILLVERDSYGAELEEYFLRTEGYDVCVAHEASDARALFNERSPDLVVIDLMISAGAGFGLSAEFAAKGNSIVLAVSSLDIPDEAVESGAAAFLRKPLEPLKLVSTVRDLLGTSALVRPVRQGVVIR